MSNERTLPISSKHRELTVKVGGQEVPREQQLVGAQIVAMVNRIASARLSYVDGSASKSDFPLSNGALFVPGREVEVLAGAGNDQKTLFKGVVVRQAIKVREKGAPQLTVECRHAATKLTLRPKSASFFDQKDSDIVSALLEAAGIACEVEDSAVTHPQQVQYRATDWDFLLARAEASGKLVLTRDDKLVIKAPALSAPVCALEFGSTILELDVELDARIQVGGVTSFTWDAAQQSVVETQGAAPSIAGPGNLSSDELASALASEPIELRHAELSEPEAQAWADAFFIKSKLSKVSGRAKCEGIATIQSGDVVTLAGAGDRYNGDVFVTGVRHDFDVANGWKTHVQLGSTERWAAIERAVSAPRAGGLLPSVSGLQIGKVTSNEDPEGEHRVRVRLPLVNADDDGIWVRVASLDAGADRGFFFRPELDDEVVVGFLEDDPRRAVILGMLHSSAKPAPLTASDDNHEKVLQTRSKLRIHFDDDKKVLRIETPAGNKITLSEDQKSLTIEDQNGNSLEMTPEGVAIEASKALTLKAGTELKLESGTAFDVKGGTDLKLAGGVTAELSSSAATKVKGAIVQIN